MSLPPSLRVLESRLLILDVKDRSVPVVTQLSLWTLKSEYSICHRLIRSLFLSAREREQIGTRGKQVVAMTHLRATHLMDTYGEQCMHMETDHELGLKLRFRILRFTNELTRFD
jgi:hypothetical protein